MSTLVPRVQDAVFCTVVIPVLPESGQAFAMSIYDVSPALYICAKTIPCPDHPQESL